MTDPLSVGIPGEYSAAMMTLFFLEKIILFCKLQTVVPEEFSSPLSKHLPIHCMLRVQIITIS